MTRIMFLDIATLHSLEDFSVNNRRLKSSGNVLEGNWDNLPSAGVSVMTIIDTALGVKTYTTETVKSGVETLKTADLIIGYNLQQFAYPILSAYSDYDLSRLPTFDMQAEIRFLQGQRSSLHWIKQADKIPYVSLFNLAEYTCAMKIYPSGREMPRLWSEGNHKIVVEYVRERVCAIQRIFNHGCKHGAVSYKNYKRREPEVLPTPLWKHKARNMVDSMVPKPYLEERCFVPSIPEYLLS